MFKLILLAAFVGAAFAGGKNKCPWVMGKYPFDEQKFVGEWKVVAGTPKMVHGMRCNKIDYQVTKENHLMSYQAIDDNGKPVKGEIYGTPFFGKSEKSANLMSVWKKPEGTYSTVFKQAIVATDYENYALMIACKPQFDETTKTFSRYLKAGILSRNNITLPDTTIEVLKNFLSSYDIDVSEVKMIDHTNC